MIQLRFSNESKVPRVIYVEPRGDDYTLLPNEELEMRIADDRPQTFHLIESDQVTQVFLESMNIKNVNTLFTVYQNGHEIHGGHNREHNPHP
jgi:hypothetical protein